MKIVFDKGPPSFDGNASAVRFLVRVNGQPVECAVSSAALQDHMGADTPMEQDVLAAFEKGRREIESICRDALELNGGEPMTITSGQLRMEKLTRRAADASQ